MQILKEMMEEIKISNLGDTVKMYEKKLNRLRAKADKMLAEGTLGPNLTRGYALPQVQSTEDGKSVPNFIPLFDEAMRRMDAAKRALGLVNKLPPGESRTMHKRRVMGNLNRIRTLVYDIQMKLGIGDEE